MRPSPSLPDPVKSTACFTQPSKCLKWLSLTCCTLCRYVLTQFNSHTLNTHISQAYPPAVFGGPQKQGFVDVLAAHQTPTEASWYRGSADAVRRNLPVILEDYRGSMLPDDMLILSGQALYRMVGPIRLQMPEPFYVLQLSDAFKQNLLVSRADDRVSMLLGFMLFSTVRALQCMMSTNECDAALPASARALTGHRAMCSHARDCGKIKSITRLATPAAVALVRVMPTEGLLATAGLRGAVENAQRKQRRHHYSHARCGPQAGCPPRHHQGGA